MRKKLNLLSVLFFVVAGFCLVNIGVMGLDAYFRHKTAQNPAGNPALQLGGDPQAALEWSNRFFYVDLCAIPGSILGAALNIFAAIKVRQGEMKELALGASVLNLLPCLFGCCLVGLPIGIYGLVVLTSAQAKAYFATKDPAERRRLDAGDADARESDDEDDR